MAISSYEAGQVMKACPGCSYHRAINLLETCEGNLEQAIAKYRFLEEELQDGEESDRASPGAISRTESKNYDAAVGECSMASAAEEDRHFAWSTLPCIPNPGKLTNSGSDEFCALELERLVGAIQAGISPERLREYLGYYDAKKLRNTINTLIRGYPAIFYVVQTHKISLIRQWIKHGGDPNATCGKDQFPLIAFAILQQTNTGRTNTQTLATLLRCGATPTSIPQSFYDPYHEDLREGGPESIHLHDIMDENKAWCTPLIRAHLAAALNITQRYELYRAGKKGEYSGREKMLVQRQNSEDVLGVYQMVIGQSIATRWLNDKLLTYLARQVKRPLVLVFAGPSGHGKTELARQFGGLMSLDIHEVDCTIFKRENELFGPRKPYEGWESGSPLNNFLSRKSGERSIVFLDEFEKTSEEIHNTLLIPFQDGRYEDRRDDSRVDCSNTIWILATNKLDETIHSFCKEYRDTLFDSDDEMAQDKLVQKLCKLLRKEFITHFGAPITGRITEFLPFLVFSPPEQTIVAHKAFLDFEADVTKPVYLAPNKDEDVYIGQVKIEVKREATVFATIAHEEYIPGLGARSVFHGVERIICDPLARLYLKNGDEFCAGQGTTNFVVGLDIDQEVEVKVVSGPSLN
ncbi:hypothetical protein JX265_009850 [Neoarthrinium moseri]|uniref:AAA+ ATPase domain-containing protein n=1 Tax=Neoarthrinium moseri TaxID=1658444 RepID=A0A9P9WEW0_9PEZI|nr:hypothetical protein JX265_009850 [Neoarthrinium moseri]